ncbi:MAG: hypothetical protein NT131_00010 [Methanomassiliicoccales archaeon]|nr:hypothetical protein [Methanomassiliicoccales archaeon]
MPTIPLRRLDAKHKLVLFTVSQIKDGVKTDVHLQKLIFLTMKALGRDPKDFGFVPHRYGAYSESVRVVNDELAQYQWVLRFNDHGSRINLAAIEDINEIAPSKESDRFKIREVASFVASLSVDEILVFTYTQDPDYAKNSEIEERILNRRIPLALKMVREGKVSITKGANIAGIPLRDFESRLAKHRVRS